MSDLSVALAVAAAPSGARHTRDFHPEPAPGPAAGEVAPLPWVALTKADCVLWAIALHRAAVAARLSGRED